MFPSNKIVKIFNLQTKILTKKYKKISVVFKIAFAVIVITLLVNIIIVLQ